MAVEREVVASQVPCSARTTLVFFSSLCIFFFFTIDPLVSVSCVKSS